MKTHEKIQNILFISLFEIFGEEDFIMHTGERKPLIYILLVFQKIQLVEVQLKRISVSASHLDVRFSYDNLFSKEADIKKPNQATLIQSAYNGYPDIKPEKQLIQI